MADNRRMIRPNFLEYYEPVVNDKERSAQALLWVKIQQAVDRVPEEQRRKSYITARSMVGGFAVFGKN